MLILHNLQGLTNSLFANWTDGSDSPSSSSPMSRNSSVCPTVIFDALAGDFLFELRRHHSPKFRSSQFSHALSRRDPDSPAGIPPLGGCCTACGVPRPALP